MTSCSFLGFKLSDLQLLLTVQKICAITEKCDQFNEETINKFIMLFFPFYISGSIYKIGNLLSHN